MIHVTSGSYKSISLEIFLNFFSLLSFEEQKNFTLHINQRFLNEYSEQAKCSFKNLKILDFACLDSQELCMKSLESALNIIGKNDYLLTLPANKEDLHDKDQIYLGHTEYLRSLFSLPHLPMTFVTPNLVMLLLTDHNPLNQVTTLITPGLIIDKFSLLMKHYPHSYKIKRVLFWGINPHAGENTMLGTEEDVIINALKVLKQLYPQLNFLGPLPSDGNFTYKGSNQELDLIVSPYHDQGLVYLKSTFGFFASNVTFGCPFIRLSPDHGTAAHLMFKKKALYTSLLWTYQLIKSWS